MFWQWTSEAQASLSVLQLFVVFKPQTQDLSLLMKEILRLYRILFIVQGFTCNRCLAGSVTPFWVGYVTLKRYKVIVVTCSDRQRGKQKVCRQPSCPDTEIASASRCRGQDTGAGCLQVLWWLATLTPWREGTCPPWFCNVSRPDRSHMKTSCAAAGSCHAPLWCSPGGLPESESSNKIEHQHFIHLQAHGANRRPVEFSWGSASNSQRSKRMLEAWGKTFLTKAATTSYWAAALMMVQQDQKQPPRCLHHYPNLPSTHRKRWHHPLSSTNQTWEWRCWHCSIASSWFWSHRLVGATGMSHSFQPLPRSMWPIWCWYLHQMHPRQRIVRNPRWLFPSQTLKLFHLHCRAQSRRYGPPNPCSQLQSPTSRMNRLEPQWVAVGWALLVQQDQKQPPRCLHHYPNLPSTHRKRWHHPLSSTNQTWEWRCWHCSIASSWFWSHHLVGATGMSRSFQPLPQSMWPIWCWYLHQMHPRQRIVHNPRWLFPCQTLKLLHLHCRAQSRRYGPPNPCSQLQSPTSRKNRLERVAVARVEQLSRRQPHWCLCPYPDLPSTHRKRWQHPLSSTNQTWEWRCFFR